uniref:Uncharacterized protein n=1 Tax=Caenorhabditis japonica TaxID=281687 RepID=A0A8R1DTI2_CAEJA
MQQTRLVQVSIVLVLAVSLFPPLSIARPPGRVEYEQQKLTGGEATESEEVPAVDYFEDFFPVLHNSTKLHENYHLEKKKYLTSVLGYPAKMRKMS